MGWTNLPSQRKKITARAEKLVVVVGGVQLEGYMGTVENRTAIWRDHDKLEEWADRSLMKVKDSTMQQSRLGTA